MKTFKLSGRVTVSVSTIVEAETLEEAIRLAKGRDIESANNWDSETQSTESWINDSYDGEVSDIYED